MSSCFYDNGLKFNCTMCPNCCCLEGGAVLLSDNDLDRLCSYFKIDHIKFIEKYCQWLENTDGYYYLCLNDKNGSECIFWEKGCNAYEGRPTQCRTYPWWTKILESKGAWNEEKSFCPGIDEGPLVDKKTISEQLEQYKTNRKNVIKVKKEAEDTEETEN